MGGMRVLERSIFETAGQVCALPNAHRIRLGRDPSRVRIQDCPCSFLASAMQDAWASSASESHFSLATA